ncbi:MAG: hypothetical protein J6A30_03845 [Ruminococcus sp.]|nr:hypothetical protein [Ruminococcus sp.]
MNISDINKTLKEDKEKMFKDDDGDYERGYVTNITSDVVRMMYGYEFHKVICDCSNMSYAENQVCRIFSPNEYRSVMERGYYLIEIRADEE